jgi:hypothetical protein
MSNGAFTVDRRVARWYFFKPKIPIWVNFGAFRNGRCWYILWPFGLCCGHLVYFVVIWYILWPFGLFYGHLVYIVLPFSIFCGHLPSISYGHLLHFSPFGMLYQKKSGNPGRSAKQCL